MRTTRRNFLGCSSLVFPGARLGISLSQRAAAGSAHEPIAVVVARNSALDGVSFYDLKRLYLGDKMQAPDGVNLIPLNRGVSSKERIAFDHTVLGMSPDEAARYWIDRRIRGQSGAPKAIDPGFVLQRVVAKLPGAIGYVLASEVSPALKVVQIDGKLPGQSGYAVLALVAAGHAGATASHPSFEGEF